MMIFRLLLRCLPFVSCTALAAPPAYPPVSVPMELKRVSEHVYYAQGLAGAAFEHQGFISNAAAIVTGDGVVVVDALGSPALAAAFLVQLRQVTDQPVTRVVVTHYHADHIYGLQVFKDLGAEIIAPVGADRYLDSREAAERLEERRFSLEPWVNERTRLVAPDRMVDGELHLRQGGVDIRLTFIGAAHSEGDLTLLVEPDNVLVSGDVIFEGRVPFVGDADTAHWLAVLEQMEGRRVAALIPGHGPAAKDPNTALALTRRYLSFVRERMAQAVAEFVPFDEAYAATDWSAFSALPAFEATNRRNAYQVYLAAEAAALGP